MTQLDLRVARRYFYCIDSLFKLAWVLWVPTFFLYLILLFDGNQSLATSIVLVTYVFMFLFEVTTGALGDTASGIKPFYFACVISSVSYGVYAFAGLDPGVDNRYWICVIAEVIGGIGMSLFSGAFERWFQSTLELYGERRSPSEVFSGLRKLRHAMSIIGGTTGIVLYDRFVAAEHQRGEITAGSLVWLPHTWSALLVLLAAALAYGLRRTLVRRDMMVAGGRLAGEVPSPLEIASAGAGALTLRSLARRARAAKMSIRQRTLATVSQGWRVLLTMPPLRGAVYITSAHQLALTIASFIFPTLLWVEEAGREAYALITYWLATQLLRLLGAHLGRGAALLSRWQPGEVAVSGTALMGIVFLVAGISVLAGAPPLWIGITGGAIMFLLGLIEPFVDGTVQGFSPPDLRSVLASYKSMLSMGFCVVALVPINLVATWTRNGPSVSFAHFFAAAGAVIVTVAFLSVKEFALSPSVFSLAEDHHDAK